MQHNHRNDDLHAQLKQRFGFDGFRDGQKAVIEALLSGDSSLAIFPTGSGKSLCYQFAATQLPQLTLVVSPLLALIKDQLDFLHQHNVPAASLDSTLNSEQYQQVVADLRNRRLKILMISVERFKNERFRLLIETIPISLLVIDEAHCISEWGHNFRPDYLKLPHYRQQLNIPQVLLLTATATRKVKLDMSAKFSIKPDRIVQTGFYRSNLHLSVQPTREKDKLNALVQLIHHQTTQHGGCANGIVYVTLQQSAETLANQLTNAGVLATAYHAGLKHEVRQQIQEAFMGGHTPVIVATIAFGMGIDKSDIRFVVHYDLPKSIENYSQEIGRAGRDGKPSYCYVLADVFGLNTIENFVYGDTPERWSIERVIETIKVRESLVWETQLYQLSKLSNIRPLTLKTLLVKLEMHGILSPRYSYSKDYSIKLLVSPSVILSKFSGERLTFVQALLDATQMRKTWGTVDFETMYQHNPHQHNQLKGYGSNRKRAIAAMEYFRDNGWIELKTSGTVECFSVNNEALHNPQIPHTLYDEFKQHEANEIKRITLILRFLQSRCCLSFGLAKYFDDHRAPAHCGHCSVCEGQPATLSDRVMTEPNISLEVITSIAHQLKRHLRDFGLNHCSNTLVARFLVGINTPIFTHSKVKQQVTGFGIAESMRYEAIMDVLEQIMS